ncbi:hypothetical protein O0V09_15125 [Dasania sp. GY-19]|uniref:Uncharacterized protein n=2 Tax=Gammaproteobacteria TaxID=1236 RepID=A0AA37S8T9_9GAMM|nr:MULTISPECIES: hypothetical protein [Gammaproteobacteria]MCZ0866543.1 hypothetical protein [Dasania phycosphaerae]GLQ31402.1 hypothetical protein GCM10007876_18810 [Litoribrevibacter albus]|tara:strand:+ start:217 stop:651 length:435 start_codon:yes stop_codon:yes gene_type:complete
MSVPLNINLIIPFKDNKAGRLNLYRKEIEAFKEMLGQRVEELKEELVSLLGEDFELTLAARSDGNSRKYYWRFKSSKRDRKYNRLHADSIVEYLRVFDDERKLRLKETEEELIYINANLKLIKGMLDSIDQSVDEKAELRSAII